MPLPKEGVETQTSALSNDEAAEALLNRWKDAEQPSDNEEGAKPPRRSETERDDTGEDDNDNESDDDDLILEDEEDGSDEGDDEGDGPVEAPENAVVKIKVGDEEITAKVSDLKRLYGQEASLTRKSQEVAQTRKQVDTELERFSAATGRLLEKATERFKPYAEIDWAVAAKALDTEEYTALRQEAKAAYTDVQFLQQELNGVVEEAQKSRAAQLEQDAKKAIEVLTGENGIPGFNEEVYQSMADHFVSLGGSLENYAQVVDPVALIILHNSMKYQQARERAATKRKAAPTSKRTMKSNKRSGTGRVGDKAGEALEKLSKTGSRDDAVSLLLGRWKDAGDQ
jgi:hypothetical protein